RQVSDADLAFDYTLDITAPVQLERRRTRLDDEIAPGRQGGQGEIGARHLEPGYTRPGFQVQRERAVGDRDLRHVDLDETADRLVGEVEHEFEWPAVGAYGAHLRRGAMQASRRDAHAG